MTIYEQYAAPDLRLSSAAVLGCAVVGLGLVLIYIPISEWILSFLRCAGLVLIAAALLAAVRFMATVFVYRIDREENGEYCFTVYECRFKHQRCVCRISASSFMSFSEPSKKRLRPKRGTACYNYCPDMRRKRAVLIVEDDGPAEMYLMPDEKMIFILKSLIPKEKN